MSGYTPTTEEVRSLIESLGYVWTMDGADFDRWLARERAEVWNAALEAARNEILDVTVILDGTEFVFAEDVRDDLDALKREEA